MACGILKAVTAGHLFFLHEDMIFRKLSAKLHHFRLPCKFVATPETIFGMWKTRNFKLVLVVTRRIVFIKNYEYMINTLRILPAHCSAFKWYKITAQLSNTRLMKLDNELCILILLIVRSRATCWWINSLFQILMTKFNFCLSSVDNTFWKLFTCK